MKTVFFLIILTGLTAKADLNFEMIGGGLTNHLWNDGETSRLMSNKLFNDGRWVYTPLFGLGLELVKDETFTSIKSFEGLNSVGSQIWGLTVSRGHQFKYVELGGILGAYVQNDNDFYNRGLVPFSIGNGLVPIVGAEINFKVDLNKDYYIKLNNVITPVITNHTLTLGYYWL